ncbi:diadenylate cyclase [Desulfobacula sp.]|uniref:diadenylate cyclase n=1 Tax=Desulfobacula sp. TaxID=2593537 RepID=UPI0025C6E871|nr:diadenylate cyclase [Desulfobacula sp.]MBC2705355.1 diadenylate cyclase [Desulfobacula sp.]
MNLFAILSNIGLPDILDILFISIVSYQLYIWFWGTKAFKALIGIILLSGVFIVAKSWGLFLTTWVFQILWQVFVILLIILFQREIRQMLERFNPLKTIGFKYKSAADGWVPPFAGWAFDVAKKRIGALIVFERIDLVFDLITKGISMECDPQPEILDSIFYKESPLHDGAILVSKGKILKTSCYLPLSAREDLPQEWGTRHRAALGLTEQCDAWVMIISEERGEVSFAVDNDIRKVNDEKELAALLEDAAFDFKETDTDIKKKIKSWFTRRYKIKTIVLALVFIMWLLFAGQQNFEKKINLPLNFRNTPAGLMVSQPIDPKISIICRGLRKDVSLLDENNIITSIDLFSARPGTSFYNITTGNLTLPNDRVHIVHITPARIELTLGKRPKPDQEDKPSIESELY